MANRRESSRPKPERGQTTARSRQCAARQLRHRRFEHLREWLWFPDSYCLPPPREATVFGQKIYKYDSIGSAPSVPDSAARYSGASMVSSVLRTRTNRPPMSSFSATSAWLLFFKNWLR